MWKLRGVNVFNVYKCVYLQERNSCGGPLAVCERIHLPRKGLREFVSLLKEGIANTFQSEILSSSDEFKLKY